MPSEPNRIRLGTNEKVHKHNLNNNKKQIKELNLKSFNEITPENWQNYIRHCEEFEKNHWETDGILESNIENFVINFEEETDDEKEDSNFSFTDILIEYNNGINFIDHNYCKK